MKKKTRMFVNTNNFLAPIKIFSVTTAFIYLPFTAQADSINFNQVINNVPFFSFDSNDTDSSPDVIFSTTHDEGLFNRNNEGLIVLGDKEPDLRVDFLRGAINDIYFLFTPSMGQDQFITFNVFAEDGSQITSVQESTRYLGDEFSTSCDGNDSDGAFVCGGEVFASLGGEIATHATFDFFNSGNFDLLNSFDYTPSSGGLISSFMGVFPENPLFGTVTTGSDGNPAFEFDLSVTEGGLGDLFPIFIDPDVAVGYDYTSNSGNPFSSVLIPDPLANGDMDFTLVLPGFGSIPIAVGDSIDLLTIDPNGFTEFSILDISTAEALDPNDSMAFVTGLTFLNSGSTSVTQAPIIETINEVPVPASIMLIASGLAGFSFRSRRQQQ